MPPPRHAGSGVIAALRVVLLLLGALLLLGSIAAAAGYVMQSAASSLAENAPWLSLYILAMGTMAAAILWSLAAILWLLEHRPAPKAVPAADVLAPQLAQIEQSLRNLSHNVPPPAPERIIEAAGPVAPLSPDVLPLLRQLRDVLLMNDAQRAVAAARHWADQKKFLLAAFHNHMRAVNYAAASHVLENLAAILPGDPDHVALTAELARQQEAHLQADLAAAQENVRHLMSVSAWDQAAQVASDLVQKYPAASGAVELQANVMHERQVLEAEHVARLFQEITEMTEHRQWQRASELADEIVRRYPGDRRTERLRQGLPTMRENAAAQERKEQEELFKDLLKRQRYDEAIQVAQSVIGKYPLSPAAAELTRLLPKVEEMARGEQAKRLDNLV